MPNPGDVLVKQGEGVAYVTFHGDATLAPDGTIAVAGVCPVVASADLANQHAATTLCSCTPPATGVFRVGAYLVVTSGPASAASVQVDYTDPSGVARTQALASVADVRARGGSPVTVRVAVSGGAPVAYDCGATIQAVR